jgi:hypothetical protein
LFTEQGEVIVTRLMLLRREELRSEPAKAIEMQLTSKLGLGNSRIGDVDWLPKNVFHALGAH